ncbi:MAG: ABC transporter permease subunit [Gammaproteobacteria bacterium]|nr:ABC transporter permease subunit [Gammaproteobacteria bacterium]
MGFTGRSAVIAIPYLWLLLFFLVPFAFVLKISLAEALIARPPYSSLFEWTEEAYLVIKMNVANYQFLIEDDLYWTAYLNSAKVALISTFFCLVIGYPMAYGMARADPSWRNVLLLLVILPFWTSFLLRVYAWIGILKNNGIINNILMGLGIIDEPIVMMQTNFAVYLGIVYSYLPFMILPLYANLERLDRTLLEAAADLGCRPIKAFVYITLPLSLPGIIAGSLLVFIPAVGEFVIPALLGGPDTLMIGRVLWDEFFANRDWPVASAVAIAILLLLVVPIVIFQRFQAHEAGA